MRALEIAKLQTSRHLQARYDVSREPAILQFGKPVPTFPSHIHLFELSPSVCNSISSNDRQQMLADLQTVGLLRLPFEQIAVRFYLPDLVPKPGRKALVTFWVSGALSIHPKDASLVSARNMFERVEVRSLSGKTEVLTTSDV